MTVYATQAELKAGVSDTHHLIHNTPCSRKLRFWEFIDMQWNIGLEKLSLPFQSWACEGD